MINAYFIITGTVVSQKKTGGMIFMLPLILKTTHNTVRKDTEKVNSMQQESSYLKTMKNESIHDSWLIGYWFTN